MSDEASRLTDPTIIARVVALVRGEPEPAPADARVTPGDLTTLYRVYDGAGQLLYAGITDRQGFSRFEEHDYERPWWFEARVIKLTHYATRPEALEAELVVIHTEKPKYNYLGRNDAELNS
jgi:hypothetical protein